jgi:hypothetical protein
MGEIINVDFSKGEVIKPKQEPKKPGAVDGFEGLYFDTFLTSRNMITYLESLQYRSSHTTRALREDMVKQLSDVEVCETIINSGETDWQRDPSYYEALLNRFQLLVHKRRGAD